MKISIHEAKTSLSKLIQSVLAGEEVIIAKSGTPLVKLVPVENQGGRRPLGLFRDKIRFCKDIMAPLPDEIIDSFWRKGEDNALSS